MRSTASVLGALLIVAGTGCALSRSDAPGEAALVECFEADYAFEPAFDRPEDAVVHALETEASLGPLPGTLDDYQRVERSERRIDFEFRESDDDYVVWSTTRDEDGRWGMVAVSACRPDGS